MVIFLGKWALGRAAGMAAAKNRLEAAEGAGLLHKREKGGDGKKRVQRCAGWAGAGVAREALSCAESGAER